MLKISSHKYQGEAGFSQVEYLKLCSFKTMTFPNMAAFYSGSHTQKQWCEPTIRIAHQVYTTKTQATAHTTFPW